MGKGHRSGCFEQPVEKPSCTLADLQQFEVQRLVGQVVGDPAFHQPRERLERACDSFFQTPLDADLRAMGVNRLIVAGCGTEYCVDTSVRRAVTLGYDVVLVSDGHTTADTRGLSFEQIIAHHNALLEDFGAGGHAVSVLPCASIEF